MALRDRLQCMQLPSSNPSIYMHTAELLLGKCFWHTHSNCGHRDSRSAVIDTPAVIASTGNICMSAASRVTLARVPMDSRGVAVCGFYKCAEGSGASAFFSTVAKQAQHGAPTGLSLRANVSSLYDCGLLILSLTWMGSEL